MEKVDIEDIERSVLWSLLNDKAIARTNYNIVYPEWFSTKQRRFILDLIQSYIKASSSLVSDLVFHTELQTHIDEKEHITYESEWTQIQGMIVKTEFSALVVLLENLYKQNGFLGLLKQATEYASEGKIDDGIKMLQRGSLKLTSAKDSSKVVNLAHNEERRLLMVDKFTNPEKYSGYQTGFKTYDKDVGGLFSAEYCLFCAVTGVGKSTFLKALVSKILRSNPTRKMNILHVANEENLLQVQHKYDAILTRIPYFDFKKCKIIDARRQDDLQRWEDSMKELRESGNNLLIQEIPAWTSTDMISKTLYQLEEEGTKVHIVVVDYLSQMIPRVGAWGENDERGKASSDMKELAINFNIPVISAAQGATVLDDKQKSGKKAGSLDVYGSKAQIHPANIFGVIMLRSHDTSPEAMKLEKWQRDRFWTMEIKKHRDGATSEFVVRHYVQDGYLEEMSKKQVEEIDDKDKFAKKTSTTVAVPALPAKKDDMTKTEAGTVSAISAAQEEAKTMQESEKNKIINSADAGIIARLKEDGKVEIKENVFGSAAEDEGEIEPDEKDDLPMPEEFAPPVEKVEVKVEVEKKVEKPAEAEVKAPAVRDAAWFAARFGKKKE